MTRLALVLCGFLIYFIQAQLLPAIFHTNWLPNLIFDHHCYSHTI